MVTINITERLQLRPLQDADAPQLFALVDSNRDYIGEYLPWVAKTTQEVDSLAFIQNCAKEWEDGSAAHFGIFTDGELVGHISLMHIEPEHKGEIGYWLSRPAAGQGTMTQAVRAIVNYSFIERKLVRVLIRCRTDNARSAAVARRLGFTFEGTERQGDLQDGQYYDFDHYALLAREWATTA